MVIKLASNFGFVGSFKNLQEDSLNFETVYHRILSFMQKDPSGEYKLMVGTDSQVHQSKTLFITGIVIQNAGKGAWACIKEQEIPRKMIHLHERISFETALTEEVVAMFLEDKKERLMDVVLPHVYRGGSFTMEGHLDIGSGKRNRTKEFVKEMVMRLKSLGVEPKIKPEAFVASCYANRFTK